VNGWINKKINRLVIIDKREYKKKSSIYKNAFSSDINTNDKCCDNENCEKKKVFNLWWKGAGIFF
jgi:hypothetical protein